MDRDAMLSSISELLRAAYARKYPAEQQPSQKSALADVREKYRNESDEILAGFLHRLREEQK